MIFCMIFIKYDIQYNNMITSAILLSFQSSLDKQIITSS